MAIPTWVSVGALAAGTGDVAPTPGAGSLIGDIIVLLVGGSYTGRTNENVAPSGYTWKASAVQDDSGGNAGVRGELLWKRASVDNEPAPTVLDRGSYTIGAAAVVRGCVATGDPFSNVATRAQGNAPSNPQSIVGGTTVDADCLVFMVHFSGRDLSNLTWSNWANAGLANVTGRFSGSTTSGDGGGLGFATGEKATAGAYVDGSADISSAADAVASMSFGLKPVVASGFNAGPMIHLMQIAGGLS